MTGRLVDEEKVGCKEILNLMSPDNILSLHHTVMQKNSGRITSLSEAIKDILSSTKDAEELLKRKKVQRDIIFEYLQKEGLVMPRNIDKPQLVKRTLEHWFLKKMKKKMMKERSSGSISSSSSASSSSSSSPVLLKARSTPISPPPSDPFYCRPIQERSSGSSSSSSPVLLKARSTPPPPSDPFYCRPIQASVQPENVRQPWTSTIFFTELTDDRSGLDLTAFAQQFCQWFYQLLSSQNPSLDQPAEPWGPQHFWEDVTLCLLSSAGEEFTEQFQGAELVSLRLLALARAEKLLLSPNLEPHGLRALSSPHGLVLVAVAGTIHRDGACLGIYEQVFGLIRCPRDSKWKIKFMEVKMRGKDGLCMNEMFPPTLTWDPSELQRLCR